MVISMFFLWFELLFHWFNQVSWGFACFSPGLLRGFPMELIQKGVLDGVVSCMEGLAWLAAWLSVLGPL